MFKYEEAARLCLDFAHFHGEVKVVYGCPELLFELLWCNIPVVQVPEDTEASLENLKRKEIVSGCLESDQSLHHRKFSRACLLKTQSLTLLRHRMSNASQFLQKEESRTAKIYIIEQFGEKFINTDIDLLSNRSNNKNTNPPSFLFIKSERRE